MTYRIGLRHITRIIRKVAVLPSAWSYFDLVGSIWIQEQGWYFEVPGKVAIFADSTAPSGWTGWYFDR